MPAYGKNLSPSEIEALVSFLETLHPANELPAYDASRRSVAELPANRALPEANSAGANSGPTPGSTP